MFIYFNKTSAKNIRHRSNKSSRSTIGKVYKYEIDCFVWRVTFQYPPGSVRGREGRGGSTSHWHLNSRDPACTGTQRRPTRSDNVPRTTNNLTIEKKIYFIQSTMKLLIFLSILLDTVPIYRNTRANNLFKSAKFKIYTIYKLSIRT